MTASELAAVSDVPLATVNRRSPFSRYLSGDDYGDSGALL